MSAYSDYRNYFMVFDNGISYQAEYLPVKGFKVGGNGVAYIDNNDNFKVFYNGTSNILLDIAPSDYRATNDIISFYNNQILYVFDNGKSTRLPGWVNNYVVGDSIIGYYDENSGYYKIYYNGELTNLPDAIDVNNPTSFVAGDNILAYINIDGKLKAYYHNQVYDLGTNHVSSYKSGASTVAFMDEYSQSFKVFYDGNIATMETLAPQSFQAGDNLIAYVDANNNFKIFYRGNLFTISTIAPQFYTVTDNMVVFGTDNVNFSVFHKGKTYLLERNTPTNYQKDLNAVAYLDSYGYLKLFINDEVKQVATIKTTNYTLTKNVLMYNIGMNDIRFFWNGKQY
ncbi:MAG: hypothetical protein IT235_00140 [Bacteroidia bacterium]|nr:hypothetical protein [Bacteroidia bacterium]